MDDPVKWMPRWRVAIAAAASLLAMQGCASVDPDRIGPRGLPPNVEFLDAASTATRQNDLVRALVSMAGLPNEPAIHSDDWLLVLKSGMQLVDGQCEQYLDALFKFNRERLAAQTALTATAATTTTVLSVLNAASTALAITASSFGLASVLFDTSTGTVLFLLEPSAIRNVVAEASGTYKAEVFAQPALYRSRPDAMLGLQGYLALCTPAAIEARINAAASTAVFERADNDTNNPSPGLVQRSRIGMPLSEQTPSPPAPIPMEQQALGLIGREQQLGISREEGHRIQRALCDAGRIDGDFGGQGSQTRRAIAAFQQALSYRGLPTWIELGVLSNSDANILLSAPGCSSPFETAFERFYFADPPFYQTPDRARVQEVQAALGDDQPTGELPDLRRTLAVKFPEGGGRLDSATAEELGLRP